MTEIGTDFLMGFQTALMRHLRLTDDNDSMGLAIYSAAAWEHIRELTGWDYETEEDAPPSALYAAALLITADLFEHRTAQVADALYENKAAQLLIYPHRVWQ